MTLSYRRLIGIVLANLDPFGVAVGICQQVLTGRGVVLLDDPRVPLLVEGPEDADSLPDHAVGAESGDTRIDIRRWGTMDWENRAHAMFSAAELSQPQ